MSTRLYVGNIAYRATAEDLRAAFAAVARVLSVHLPVERETGRPRGFGFVDVAAETDADADAVIESMNGQLLFDRSLVVNLARPQEERVDRRGPADGRNGSPPSYRFQRTDRPRLRSM